MLSEHIWVGTVVRRRFKAVDSKGNTYELLEEQDMLRLRDMPIGSVEIPGPTGFAEEGSGPVRENDDGSYYIELRGKRVWEV